jgi:hypothetical protein
MQCKPTSLITSYYTVLTRKTENLFDLLLLKQKMNKMVTNSVCTPYQLIGLIESQIDNSLPKPLAPANKDFITDK